MHPLAPGCAMPGKLFTTSISPSFIKKGSNSRQALVFPSWLFLRDGTDIGTDCQHGAEFDRNQIKVDNLVLHNLSLATTMQIKNDHADRSKTGQAHL